MNQLQHEQYRKVNQSESTWLTTAKAARMHCRWSSKTYFLCQEAPASCGCLLIHIDWLKSSEFRRLEIDWSDTYHNQVNRKGGFDGKNSFYSARKILFGQQRTAQRTFSKGIWTIYRRWTVQYRSFKILRLIWHPWIWGENAVCCAWTIVHKKKGANHESGNLLPPEQRRWI